MSRLLPLLGALLVLLGAFGSHALPGWLVSHGISTAELSTRMGWWHTATQYGFVHVVAALVGLPKAKSSALFFAAGTLLFSGSLFTMTWTGWRMLGAVTPLGGIAFVIGWLLLAFRVEKAGA